jgi:hypothetical protein
MPILSAPLGQLFVLSSLKLNALSWTFIRVPVAVGTIVTVVQASASMGFGDADMYMVARKSGKPLWLPTTTASINQTAPPGQLCDPVCCNPVSGQAEPCSQCMHHISFTVTDASVSEYVLGVNAACCDAALLDLTIDTRSNVSARCAPSPSPSVSPTPAGSPASSAAMTTTTIIIIICGESARHTRAFQFHDRNLFLFALSALSDLCCD